MPERRHLAIDPEAGGVSEPLLVCLYGRGVAVGAGEQHLGRVGVRGLVPRAQLLLLPGPGVVTPVAQLLRVAAGQLRGVAGAAAGSPPLPIPPARSQYPHQQ